MYLVIVHLSFHKYLVLLFGDGRFFFILWKSHLVFEYLSFVIFTQVGNS